MNNTGTDALALFAPMREGENEESDRTPRTEQTGEAEGAPDAGEQTNASREKAFRALMEGEYKDLFTAYFQETFNRRFKEHKQIKAELERAQAMISVVRERYGECSDEELLGAIRAETVSEKAPTEAQKTLAEESENAPVASAERTRAEAQAQVIAHIRARGLRPAENGLCTLGVAPGGTGHLTREERAEMARRAACGERIVL